jgi:hypothetical protein
MTCYEFKVILDTSEVSDAEVEKLYTVIDDGTQVCREGVCFVIFDRDGDSLEQAIRSAVMDVENAGLSVNRVELSRDSAIA